MSKLQNPKKLNNGVVLKNSVVMSPMTTWSSNDDYTVSEEELVYYRHRNNGPGMIITGCAHIQDNGIGFTNEFSVSDDKFLPGLTKLAATLKENGAKAILQINHAGNKALPDLINGEVVSASAVQTQATAFAPSLTPKSLTEEDIEAVIHAFGEATRRAIEAGFDGIELHGAHGFLLQNFESPFFNQRQDKWGGNINSRLAFPVAVIKEVKKVIATYADDLFILGYRLSPDEPMEGGMRMHDTYALIDALVDLNVTYIHASLPDALNSKPVDSEDDQTYLSLISKKINQRVLFIAAGTVQLPEQAESVLDKGALPAVGHTFITDPSWMDKINQPENIHLTIKKDEVETLHLPSKLWTVIQNSGPWFTIE